MIFIAILFFSPLRINLQRTDLLTRTYCFDGGRAFFFFFMKKTIVDAWWKCVWKSVSACTRREQAIRESVKAEDDERETRRILKVGREGPG